MKAFKKVIRWSPIVTVSMIAIMFAGMRAFGQGKDLSWVSDDSSKFAIRDIKALVGHDGMSHWASNSITFAAYFMPIELMLRRKHQSIMMLVGIMVAWLFTKELWFDADGIGASGWINAIPGCMLATSGWRITKSIPSPWERIEAMFLPGIVFVLAMFLANEDVKMLGEADGIGHVAHLVGAGISAAVAFVAIVACLYTWVAQAIRDAKATKVRRLRYATAF